MKANSCCRRCFLQGAAGLALAAGFPAVLRASPGIDDARASAEEAHEEVRRRFVDKHGVLLDFTDLDGSVSLPTPEECRAGKPNALGWWTPIENGAMFNGMYLDGLVLRALTTGSNDDKAKARRLVEGLLRLASCSKVKGFVGRGFANDGKTTWPMGSNDQTGPWFYGLWRYLESGLADAALRQQVVAKLREVADTLAHTGWRMPAEPPFNFRGSFAGFSWECAPRMLFVCKAMHRLTGEAAWDQRYRLALHEKPASGTISRLAHCEKGMVFEKRATGKPMRATWTGASSAICLRGLWEMERDEALRAAYLRGLQATAAMAVEGMASRRQFSHDDDSYFENDWRKLNQYWRPQQTENEAVEVAHVQVNALNKLSPRRRAELTSAREALFAAWVVTLCPDSDVLKQYENEILVTLAHFQAKKLRFVSFFPIECAWWRLRLVS